MGAESERVSGFGRLEDGLLPGAEWYRWGPYVSERQWDTVCEDYSVDGNAWDYLPYDHARSRAYRWGEDGLAGFCDIHQRLCLSLALWNGRDPILLGLTGPQGNHGEDVKEYWWYLDAVPSHAWNRWRYHYPQEFTRNLIAFRRPHPVFRRRRFLADTEASQLQWFTPAGTPVGGGDWADPNARAIAIYLDGSDDPDRAEDGTLLVDDDFLVMVNSWWEPLGFALPATRPQAGWRVEIDTYDPASQGGSETSDRKSGDHITVGPRSVVVLKNLRPPEITDGTKP
jgi:hypothetical protein